MRTTLLFLTLLLVPSVAVAQTASAKAKAQALLKDGLDLYDRGERTAALEKFQAAYAAFPSPKLLFNVGQANRDLGRRAEALDAFERFLRDATDASPETIAEARRSVAELRAQTVAAAATTAPNAFTATESAPTAAPSDSGPKKWLVWGGAAATGVFGVAAVVSGISARSRFNDLKSSCGATAAGCSSSQIDGVKSGAARTNLLWALTGVAAAATGIAFYVGSGEAGVSVAARF